MAENPQRELAKRQHRILGLYLAVSAWSNNLDAIVLERSNFTNFLSLQRVKRARVAQFEEDVRQWFPFTSAFYATDNDSLHTLYLSRVSLEAKLPSGQMNTSARVTGARQKGLAIRAFNDLAKDISKVNESDVVSFVALLASGLEIPERFDYSINLSERLHGLKKRT